MPLVAQIPGDRLYIVGLVSSYTTYSTYPLAAAAAATLSASNANATVYTGQVLEWVTAGSPGGKVNLQPGTPQTWIVELASTTKYNPLATATAQAYTTSAANSNAPCFVAHAFQQVTAP